MSEPAAPFAFDGRAIPSAAAESSWRAGDGHVIRRIDWAPPPGQMPKGALLFAPGRGDCYEKYLCVLDEWHRQGWSVTAKDWRGQALSGRTGFDARTGHIDDFASWVADFEQFWREWRDTVPGPHICVGHSMGGHILLRAVAERRVRPDALVLVAPMLGLNPGWMPTKILLPLSRAIAQLGDPRRPAWRDSELPFSTAGARMALLTHDERFYADEEWWRKERPELGMGPASWGWIAAALNSIAGLERPGVLEAIEVPVLILGTSADRLVSWPAIRRAAARLPRGELVAFGREARHELLREAPPVRTRAMAEIMDFIDRSVRTS